MSLKSFLTKHSRELNTVASALGAIVSFLPIGRQDKANISTAIDGLAKSAKNIERAARRMPKNGVDLSSDQVKDAVRELLPEMVEMVAAKVFEIGENKK